MRFSIPGKLRHSIRLASSSSSSSIKPGTKLRDWSGRIILSALAGFYSYELYHFTVAKSEMECPYRMPDLAEYIITNSSVDWGKIVYKTDGSFGQRSPLNPDEQELFHSVTSKIKSRLSDVYPNREIVFVPTFMGNKPEENVDIFDLFVIFDPKIYTADIANKIRRFLFSFEETGEMERRAEIQEEKLYVFVNSTGFFSDVMELSDQLESMLKDMSKLSGTEASVVGDSENLFRFCRSFTMSENQRESLLSICVLLDKYFADAFPYYQINYSPFAVGFLSQFLYQSFIMARASRMAMNPALAIMLGFLAVMPTTAITCQYARGALFSRFEENKRRMLHWYIDHMPLQEVKGLMTHCYRLEDRKIAQEGLFNEPEGNSRTTTTTRRQYVFSVITHCIDRLVAAGESIEPDPYEIYKDDEGFDYVYVA
ncbi:unnamed protein product [Oikopleura dioica]|uniref:Uncharacterized protein n=1 Tax=Oikopleura dioica TaxID=34765 RepID=E4WWN5_OIKDI|nr:unnamed protein product [Oikopleura dioica]